MAEPFVRAYLSGLRAVLDEVDAEAVSRVIDILWAAYGDGRRIFIIGNGGSAATASRNYGYVEDLHVVLEHLISQCLRSRIEAD